MTVKQRFKSSIKRGTGEAYLLMMQYPNLDFSADIIRASLKNLSYDNQCESRAEYVWGLIKLAKQKNKIKQAILKGLAREQEKSYALYQLFDLAASFAVAGDSEAKKAVYKRYGHKAIKASEFYGENAIIKIDGLKGLLYVAHVNGKVFDKDPEMWDDSFTVDCFQKENPKIKVYDELKKAAKSDKHIKIYLDMILKHKFRRPRRRKSDCNYETIKKWILTRRFFYLSPSRAKELPENDIKKLADDFLKEKTRIMQAKYLGIFTTVKYPYDYRILLEHAKRPYSSKDMLVERAVDALGFFTGDDIRRFALKQIRISKRPEVYTNLLMENYKEGDGKRLYDIIERTRNPHKLHDLAHSCRDIYEKNKTKDCLKPLMALYDRINCGICREDIVKIMIENDVLPERIWEEIKYDSEEETRELAKNSVK
ncbi:MAG: hypothetical protein ACIAQZ_04960 [Sedimentisphaeraceae bacterium JB056]